MEAEEGPEVPLLVPLELLFPTPFPPPAPPAPTGLVSYLSTIAKPVADLFPPRRHVATALRAAVRAAGLAVPAALQALAGLALVAKARGLLRAAFAGRPAELLRCAFGTLSWLALALLAHLLVVGAWAWALRPTRPPVRGNTRRQAMSRSQLLVLLFVLRICGRPGAPGVPTHACVHMDMHADAPARHRVARAPRVVPAGLPVTDDPRAPLTDAEVEGAKARAACAHCDDGAHCVDDSDVTHMRATSPRGTETRDPVLVVALICAATRTGLVRWQKRTVGRLAHCIAGARPHGGGGRDTAYGRLPRLTGAHVSFPGDVQTSKERTNTTPASLLTSRSHHHRPPHPTSSASGVASQRDGPQQRSPRLPLSPADLRLPLRPARLPRRPRRGGRLRRHRHCVPRHRRRAPHLHPAYLGTTQGISISRRRPQRHPRPGLPATHPRGAPRKRGPTGCGPFGRARPPGLTWPRRLHVHPQLRRGLSRWPPSGCYWLQQHPPAIPSPATCRGGASRPAPHL